MPSLRRLYIDAADESETCCSRIIRTRVWNPGFRDQSGGGPRALKIAARSLSRLASCSAANARPALVSGCGDADLSVVIDAVLGIAGIIQLERPTSSHKSHEDCYKRAKLADCPTSWLASRGPEQAR